MDGGCWEPGFSLSEREVTDELEKLKQTLWYCKRDEDHQYEDMFSLIYIFTYRQIKI